MSIIGSIQAGFVHRVCLRTHSRQNLPASTSRLNRKQCPHQFSFGKDIAMIHRKMYPHHFFYCQQQGCVQPLTSSGRVFSSTGMFSSSSSSFHLLFSCPLFLSSCPQPRHPPPPMKRTHVELHSTISTIAKVDMLDMPLPPPRNLQPFHPRWERKERAPTYVNSLCILFLSVQSIVFAVRRYMYPESFLANLWWIYYNENEYSAADHLPFIILCCAIVCCISVQRGHCLCFAKHTPRRQRQQCVWEGDDCPCTSKQCVKVVPRPNSKQKLRKYGCYSGL